MPIFCYCNVVFSYKYRVDTLLVEAEFDTVMDNVQSGVDVISFTATGPRSVTALSVCLSVCLSHTLNDVYLPACIRHVHVVSLPAIQDISCMHGVHADRFF